MQMLFLTFSYRQNAVVSHATPASAGRITSVGEFAVTARKEKRRWIPGPNSDVFG